MLIRHLTAWLAEQGINPDFCSIEEEREQRYCVVSMHGAWEVFYKERGRRSREQRFYVEADAVRHLIEMMTNDGVLKDIER